MALWFLPLVQEETFVTFEMPCIQPHLTLWDELMFLYFFGCFVATVVVLLRSWWALGFLNRGTKGTLTEVRLGIEGEDWEEVKNILIGVPVRTPEGGLRRLAETVVGIGTTNFKHALEEAGLTFDFKQGQLHAMLGRLLTAGVCAVLFSTFEAVRDVISIIREIGGAKSFGLRVVMCGVGGTLVPIATGLFVFTLIYLVYRHVSSRLEVRRNHWNYFLGSVRLWLDGKPFQEG